jgi:hypothetical protein
MRGEEGWREVDGMYHSVRLERWMEDGNLDVQGCQE